jgi:hypothetical protein
LLRKMKMVSLRVVTWSKQAGTRYFTYLEITHPADRILVVDGAALVTGRMTAKVLVAGTIVHIDNRYLAVWAHDRADSIPASRPLLT